MHAIVRRREWCVTALQRQGVVRVGRDEKRVYRRRDGGQSVWLQHDTGEVELWTSDGETLATFDEPADVFEDVDAYPATEDEISNFDEWTEISRPVIPAVAFGEDGLDRDRVDVIEVGDDLQAVEDGGRTKTPIRQLLDDVIESSDEDDESPDDTDGMISPR